jgi:hypothetical protein
MKNVGWLVRLLVPLQRLAVRVWLLVPVVCLAVRVWLLVPLVSG